MTTASHTFKQDETSITFVAGLYDIAENTNGEKHIICLNKSDGDLISMKHITISEEEMKMILSEADLGVPETITRVDRGLTPSYKVSIKNSSKQVIIQLRHYGDVDSMNSLTEYLSTILPVPKTYRTTFQVSSALGVQVTEFVEGEVGVKLYYQLDVTDKMRIVKEIARVLDTLWRIKVPEGQNRIGEAIANRDPFAITVGPERGHGLGGPFSSVTEYLKAWITHRTRAVEMTEFIDEFKEDVLPGVYQLLEWGPIIPPEVENVPVVLFHSDLALRNMIFSSSSSCTLKAVIDWELVDCAPFAVAIPMFIEPLFWKDANGKNKHAEGSSELREAFWDEIPYWKGQMENEATQCFLEWYEFGRSIVAYPPREDDTTPEQRRELWKKNTESVKRFL